MRQDIYARIYKAYGINNHNSYTKGNLINIKAFNYQTLQIILNFSKRFNDIMNPEKTMFKIQQTTTHEIYQFYQEKRKVKTIILDKEGFITSHKGHYKNLNDPYMFRIAHHKKILVFKKKYVKLTDWHSIDNHKIRKELNTETQQQYYNLKSGNWYFRIPCRTFEELKNISLIEKKPKYSYDNFIEEVRFKPETFEKSSRELSKKFGINERTIKRWKAKFMGDRSI